MFAETPTVRAATADDAAEICALQVRSWHRAYRGLVSDAFLDGLTEDAWLERWVQILNGPGRAGVHHLVSATEPDGPPCAVAACGPARSPDAALTGQLYLLYTDPARWGHGHGSALLRRTHELLATDGHTAALLWVADGNARAIGFYEHHGWRRDGATQREEVAGATFDELRMTRAFPVSEARPR